MGISRYELSEVQWEKIKNFLPGREERVGRTAGSSFRSALARSSGTVWQVHKRFSRWATGGVRKKVLLRKTQTLSPILHQIRENKASARSCGSVLRTGKHSVIFRADGSVYSRDRVPYVYAQHLSACRFCPPTGIMGTGWLLDFLAIDHTIDLHGVTLASSSRRPIAAHLIRDSLLNKYLSR